MTTVLEDIHGVLSLIGGKLDIAWKKIEKNFFNKFDQVFEAVKNVSKNKAAMKAAITSVKASIPFLAPVPDFFMRIVIKKMIGKNKRRAKRYAKRAFWIARKASKLGPKKFKALLLKSADAIEYRIDRSMSTGQEARVWRNLLQPFDVNVAMSIGLVVPQIKAHLETDVDTWNAWGYRIGNIDQRPQHCMSCAAKAHYTCAGCDLVTYCSSECQRDHWEDEHKFSCS